MTAEPYNSEAVGISRRRLWFGPLAGGVAFSLAGFTDWVISARACYIGNGYLGSVPPGGVRWILAGVTFVLFALAIAGAVTSYKDWQRLSQSSDWIHSQAQGAAEFISLFGLFVSATMAYGIFWIGLPLIFLNICMRAH